MKVISFSLYGDSPKYIVGAAKNILLAREHYPGWVCRLYVDNASARALGENDSLSFLASFQSRPGDSSIPPMLWRFMVADDPTVGRFIIRDADSRIGARESAAVREWEQSGLLFHSMRDHNAHARPMNGGLWGGMWRNHNWEAPRMIDLWNIWQAEHASSYKGHDEDQGFLNKMIWPWAQNSMLQHDSVCRSAYPGSKPFPTKRNWPRFVGEVFDERDQPRDGDFQQISKDQE